MIFPWVKLIPWGMGGIAALLLFGMGWRMGHNGQKAEVEQAEAALAAFRVELQLSEAKASAEANRRQQAAIEAINRHSDAISAEVALIPAKIAQQLAGDFATLRGSLNAPDFACLRLPLPEPALGVLRRPGGAVEAGRNPRPAEPPESLF